MPHSSSVLRSTVSVVCQIPIVLHLHTFITILALFILFACFSAKFLLFYLGGWFFLLNMLPFRTLKKIKKTKHHPSNPSYSMRKALFKFWYINPSLSCSSRDYNKKTEKTQKTHICFTGLWLEEHCLPVTTPEAKNVTLWSKPFISPTKVVLKNICIMLFLWMT